LPFVKKKKKKKMGGNGEKIYLFFKIRKQNPANKDCKMLKVFHSR